MRRFDDTSGRALRASAGARGNARDGGRRSPRRVRRRSISLAVVCAALAQAAATGCRARDESSSHSSGAAAPPDVRGLPVLDVVRHPATGDERASTLELTIPLDRWRVVPVVSDHGVALEALAPAGAVAGINGGYFDPRERPVGWRRVAGVDRSAPWFGAKGGVLALDEGRAYIGPRAEMPFSPLSAVQSKPLLVERGGQNGILADDGRRAARTIVCDAGDSALHLILFLAGPADGPTLHEAAETLRAPRSRGGFACRAALNLDGGPSTGAWFAEGTHERSELPRGTIVDGLFVVPR
jgi:hypothetical protein